MKVAGNKEFVTDGTPLDEQADDWEDWKLPILSWGGRHGCRWTDDDCEEEGLFDSGAL